MKFTFKKQNNRKIKSVQNFLLILFLIFLGFTFNLKPVEAAITYEAKGGFASDTRALTVTVPSGYQDGDVFLLFIESANETIATPSGWTQVNNSPQYTGGAAAAGGVRLAVFYKIVSGTQSSVSVADSGNHTTAIIANFRGVDTSTPIHLTSGSVDATAKTAISTPTLTTTITDTMIVNAIGLDKDLADTDTITTAWVNANLTSPTERHDQTFASGVGGGIAFATGIKAIAGVVGSTTATADSSTTHVYITIALKLKIITLPTVTTTTPVINIAGTTATGGGNVTSNGNATVTTSGLVWGTSSNPTIALSTKTTNGWADPGLWTSEMTGLTEGTLYYVRAYATNSVGTNYGDNVQFTTNSLPTVVLNSPANASSSSNATPTLNFTGTDDDSNVVEYNVQVDTTNSFNSSEANFTNASTVTKTLAAGESGGESITQDTNYIYVGTATYPAKVVRINKSDFNTTVTKTLATGEDLAYSITQDTNYIYAGLNTDPAKVVRINKSDFNTTVTKTLATGETYSYSITQDTNYIYVGTGTWPAKIVRINKSDFNTTVTKTLATGENSAFSIIQDTNYIYAGLGTIPAKVVRINKSDFNTTVTKTLATGEDYARSITQDTNYIYVGTDTDTAKVVRINKSDFNTTVTKTLAGGESFTRSIIQDTNYIYVGTGTLPAKVVRINKSDFSTTVTKTFDGENSAHLTQDTNYIYVELDTDKVVRINTASLFNKDSDIPDVGFTEGHPFASGAAKDYTVQAEDELALGTYYWRVRAKDYTDSYGAWSSVRSFTVTAEPPTVTTTNPVATSITSNTAVLNGNIISDGGSSITARGFDYSTSSSLSTGVITTTDMGNGYIENFDSTSFPPTTWTTGGSVNWLRDTSITYNSSAGSATTSNTVPASGTSWINYTKTFSNDGQVKFYWKVSSETDYDFLVFCLDLNSTCSRTVYTGANHISGNVDWVQVIVPVSAGTHNFRWMYAKDTSTIGGSDRGWIDNIEFVDNSISTGVFTTPGAITGLICSTTYYARAYAVNSDGGVGRGSINSFTPICGSSPTVTTTTPVTNIAGTTATGGGNVTSNGGATVSTSGLVWSTSTNPTIALSTKTTNGWKDPGLWTSGMTGLTKNTLYYVRAYATNSVGTSYGGNVQFTTLIEPTVTTTTPVTNIAGTTATGGGNVTSNGGATVTTSGLVWSTSSNPTIALSTKTTNGWKDPGLWTSGMTGLTEGTLYYVRAYATNSVGTSYGNNVQFTTDSLPTVVLNSPADASSSSNLTPTLNFTGTDADSDDVEYNVQIDTANSFNSQVLLSDDFNNDSMDLVKWTPDYYLATISESGQKIIITLTPNTLGSYGQLLSSTNYVDNFFDLTGISAQVEVSQVAAGTDVGTSLKLKKDPSNDLQIYQSNGYLFAKKKIATINTDITSIVYNSTSMRYWSISESNGSIYYEYSANGISWTELTHITNPFAITLMEPILVTEENSPDPSAGAAWFNNFIFGNSILNKFSTTDIGFTTGHPFTSGIAKDFTVQAIDTLDPGTYYWRARAKDYTDSYGAWSSVRSFTVVVSVVGMPVSGTLTSSVFDTANSSSIGYNSIMWKGTLGGEGKVRFQFAASSSASGPWSFYGGSTCSSGDWFDPLGPDTPIEIKEGVGCTDEWNNKRYFKYKVQLCSKDCVDVGEGDPTVDDIIVNWSL